jgi:RNA polymerase sigma-70 factor, ECF subfamily
VSSPDPKSEYAALVRDAAAGDRDAMERLLMRAQEVAYRFSLLVCGHPEDAEDVMQDALLKTYQHVAQIDDPGAFRTWLYTTVRNACLMKRRRHAGEPSEFMSVDDLSLPDHAQQPDAQAIDAWMDRRLRAALNTLRADYRMIIVMREIDGLSTKEVAEVAGISEANVKTRLHRARLMLREHLRDL